MTELVALFLIVLGVNLLPAFGPPTWSIIAYFGLSTDHPLWTLVAVGATAAALGRLLLALAAQKSRVFLGPGRRANLDSARTLMASRRSTLWLALGLFAVSPLPSGQLFVAAGLTQARLVPFTAAFFCGRIVSYSVYAFTARSLRDSALGASIRAGFSDPLWIALEVGSLVFLAALLRVDWRTRFARR